MNGSQNFLEDGFNTIYNLSLSNDKLRLILDRILSSFEVQPVIAFDEIQTFGFNNQRIIMAFADLTNFNEKEFDTVKREPKTLYPALYAIQKCLYNLEIGTILSGINPQYSSLDKSIKDVSPITGANFYKVINFRRCDNPIQFFESMLNVNKEDLESISEMKYFQGRFRFASLLLFQLSIYKTIDIDSLNRCITEVLKELERTLVNLMSPFEETDLIYSFRLLFSDTINSDYFSYNFKLFNFLYNTSDETNYYMPVSSQPDFKLKLDEPLTKRVLERHLSNQKFNALPQIFMNFSSETQTMPCKGTFFQNIFLKYLYLFAKDGNRKLLDLPFLKNHEALPNWLSDIDFKVSSIKFHLTQAQDYDFLLSFVQTNLNTNTLLCPSELTGPDGLLILNTKQSFHLLLLIGSKYSSKKITDTTLVANDSATNFANLFKIKGKETSIRRNYLKNLYKQLANKVKILYLLIEYSEVNSTMKANEFISDHQKINTEQFSIQLTENEIIESFKESENADFKTFGNALENSLRNSAKVPKMPSNILVSHEKKDSKRVPSSSKRQQDSHDDELQIVKKSKMDG